MTNELRKMFEEHRIKSENYLITQLLKYNSKDDLIKKGGDELHKRIKGYGYILESQNGTSLIYSWGPQRVYVNLGKDYKQINRFFANVCYPVSSN